MKSAALLPTPGDPFQVAYWLRNYERVWRGEVDELIVHVNAQPVDEARAFIREQVERFPEGRYLEWNGGGRMSHGDSLNILVGECDADLVVLIEDDTPVRRSGAIRHYLLDVFSGATDVVASPRGSMTPELQQAALERWGEIRTEDGSSGHGMWPAFVFCRLQTLLDTDRHFGERAWSPGRDVAGLRYTIQGSEQAVADTFGATAFQLRDRCHVLNVSQWKGPWGWQGWLDEGLPFPWFHIGSLSSSGNLVLETAELMEGRLLSEEQELGEWSHRVHWWARFLRFAGDALPDLQENYRRNLTRLCDVMGIDDWRIRAWGDVVNRMVTWEEQP